MQLTSPDLKISLACHLLPGIAWFMLSSMSDGRVTCEDVLRHDFGLHFQRMLGGVRYLGAHVSHFADKDGRQEFGLLHPDQSCNTAVLKGQRRTWWSHQRYQGSEPSSMGPSLGTPVHDHLHTGIIDSVACSFLVTDESREEGDNPDFQTKSLNQSDSEGMFRTMLTKDCSQPDSGLIWTVTCRPSTQVTWHDKWKAHI